MTEEKPDLDRWDDFSGKFIKTDLVKFPLVIVPVSLDAEYDENNKPRMVIEFSLNGRNWNLELNKTNQNFIRSSGFVPSGIIGKKLTFDTTKVRNPSSNQMVDSFLLTGIE